MIDVIFLPSQLPPERLATSQVVVLDILRATTTIVTALANGARSVHLFGDIESATAAQKTLPAPALLGGERGGTKIPGFDLANSPAEYQTHAIGGSTICLTTTNGTLAALAAQSADDVYIGSLLNASASTAALIPTLERRDTFLLCAGTEGRVSSEDILGAGAILFQLLQQTHSYALPFTDSAWIAYQAYVATRNHLAAALRLGQGAINLMEKGMEDDIDLCAQIDSKPILVKLMNHPLRALRVDQ